MINSMMFKPKYKEKLWHPKRFQWWQYISQSTKESDINFDKVEISISGKVYKDRNEEFLRAFAAERLWDKLQND